MNTSLMHLTRRRVGSLFLGAAIVIVALCISQAQTPETLNTRPTLFLIGDSTVKNGTKGQMGWGEALSSYLDGAKLHLTNRARGGRSSRTYLTEGLWNETLALVKPGDVVLMQFGHNDGGPMDEGRARASIQGSGPETRDITIKETGKKETVLTYGAYMRRYITDAKAKGATVVVLSPVPRNRWKEGEASTVHRANGDYGKWAKEAATQAGAHFVDLNEIVARAYEAQGKEKTALLFTSADWTHTNGDGAKRSAECVVAGLKALGANCPPALASAWSEAGRTVAPAPFELATPLPTTTGTIK